LLFFTKLSNQSFFMEQQRDQRLWRIATKRANFRRHLISYFVMNAFLWCIWWFTAGRHGTGRFPWPLWVMLGWGLALGLNYFDAYGESREDMAQKEYDKLKREEEKS
jgi:2TM domain